MDKGLFGYLSLLLTVAAYAPYVWMTWRGSNRPHVFSWAIWSLLMSIAAAAQYAGAAGPGYWATACSAGFCIVIAAMALYGGEKNITRSDWAFLAAALAAIPLWAATDEPLAAVLLVTAVDLLGYGPTLRKSWARPREEMALHYVISNAKHIASIAAISVYSLTTALYPAALIAANSVLVAVIMARRARLAAAR
ncbi:MAG: hypothetical protein GC131_02720 [Alphaproteobacteria bacterium]|nr:hypothetical protein [Alphaproteobacteria bacterium]